MLNCFNRFSTDRKLTDDYADVPAIIIKQWWTLRLSESCARELRSFPRDRRVRG